MSHRIDIAVFDGFDELDVVGPWEALRVASALGAAIDVRLAHPAPVGRVRGRLGLQIGVDGPLRPEADVLVVPGVGTEIGASRAPGLVPAIRAAHERGAVVASVCTGAFLLAEAGLLADRSATTHWDVLDELRSRGVDAVDARVVDDGDVLTSGGVTCGIDLGLHLVHRLVGEEIAYLTACRLDHEPAAAARA